MQRRTDARRIDYPPTTAEDSLEKAKQLVGLKAYVANIPASTMAAPEVLSSYHDLWHVEHPFRMSKAVLQARPVFHPYGGTQITDPQIASYIGGSTVTRAALDATYLPRAEVASTMGFDEVITSESISSTDYVDAATVGLTVIVEVADSGLLRLDLRARLQHGSEKMFMFDGYELSGSNVLAPDDDRALGFQSAIPNHTIQLGATFMLENLNAGTTTVTMKYRSSALTGTIRRRFLMATTLPIL